MIKSAARANAGPVAATTAADGLSRIDLSVWIGLIAALLLLRELPPAFAPALSPDSFQYLSAAKNVLQGLFGYTSLIHYDAERSFGEVPAPMVTFAMGYPILIAAISLFGASLQSAALIVSITSTVACVPVLAWIAKRLGLTRVLCNAVVGCFVINGAVVEFGRSLLSEAPFALSLLLGTALLIRATDASKRRAWLGWVAAGCAFAAAYSIRYAGLFFIVALAILTACHGVAGHKARARGYATALAVSLVPVVIVISRNFALVGNWRGRDEMLVSNPLHAALIETAQATNALFLGSGTAAATPGGTFVPKATFVALVVAGLALLSWSAVRDRGTGTGLELVTKQLRMGIDILLLVVIYVGCMFYAGMTSSVSYGSARNFVAIAALLFLLFGWGVAIALQRIPPSRRLRRIALLSLAASLLPYAYLNSLVLLRAPSDASAGARTQMDAIADGGISTRAAITQIVGDAVIMANNGQAVGHVLGLRTISLVGPAFSTVDWNEATVRATIQRFNVGAVVITAPTAEKPEDDAMPSAFTRQLALGNSPSWLRLALRSGRVLVYVPDLSTP
jgi:hypothetical protein